MPDDAIHGRDHALKELEVGAKFLRRIAKPDPIPGHKALTGKGLASPTVVRIADLTLDTGQRRCWRGDNEIDLPRLSFDLLAALVEAAPNSLSTDEIMDRVWDDTVVSPATVAKRVELVREALDDNSNDPRYIALVRGHGYRLIPSVGATGSGRHTAGRQWPLILAATAVLVVGLVLYFSGRPTAAPDKSIAVLPFVAMTNEPDAEIFADGLTDELSHALARLEDLKVVGRTSSFYFKGRNEDLREIGDILGVAHVLEGSVRQSGDQLRVTAQLVNTSDGFRLWSESYDRELSDIINIQKDIARAVATELRTSMTDKSTPDLLFAAAIDPEAYALYLKGVSQSPYGKTLDLGQAQALLEQVTEMAPNFAPGWNRLAAIHGRRLVFEDPGYDLTPQESLRISSEAVSKALALDPDSGEAYANLGGAAWAFERNVEKAAPLIEKALELDPWNLGIVTFAADFAKYIGHMAEALELEQVLIARDPLCQTCRANLARSYLFAGRYEDAESQYRTLQSMQGGYHWTLGVVLLMQQRPELALESFKSQTAFEYLRKLGEAMALHDLGRQSESAQLIAEVDANWSNDAPLELAQAMAYIGEVDDAFEKLHGALPQFTLLLQTSYPNPLYDTLRDDPRWLSLMEGIGRSPEQLAQIQFSLDGARERLGL